MSDRFRRVASGQPLSLSATQHNAMLDAAEAYARTRAGKSKDFTPGRGIVAANEVLILNDTGSDLDSGGVVTYYDQPDLGAAEITDPFAEANLALEPAGGEPSEEGSEQIPQNADARRRPAYRVIAPKYADYPILITSEPIPKGQIGRAVVSGQAVTRVYISDLTHRFAEPVRDQTGYLQSAPVGPVRITGRRRDGDSEWAIGYQSCLVLLTEAPTAGTQVYTTGPANQKFPPQVDSSLTEASEYIANSDAKPGLRPGVRSTLAKCLTLPRGRSVEWLIMGAVQGSIVVADADMDQPLNLICYLSKYDVLTLYGESTGITETVENILFSGYALSTNEAKEGVYYGSAAAQFTVAGTDSEQIIYVSSGLEYDTHASGLPLPTGITLHGKAYPRLAAIPVYRGHNSRQAYSAPVASVGVPLPPEPFAMRISEPREGQQFLVGETFAITAAIEGGNGADFNVDTWYATSGDGRGGDYPTGADTLSINGGLYTTPGTYKITVWVDSFDVQNADLFDDVTVIIAASPPPPGPPPPPPPGLTVAFATDPLPYPPGLDGEYNATIHAAPFTGSYTITVTGGTPPYEIGYTTEDTGGAFAFPVSNTAVTAGFTINGNSLTVANAGQVIPVNFSVRDAIGNHWTRSLGFAVARYSDGLTCPFGFPIVLDEIDVRPIAVYETIWYTCFFPNGTMSGIAGQVQLSGPSGFAFPHTTIYEVCGGSSVASSTTGYISFGVPPGGKQFYIRLEEADGYSGDVSITASLM